MLKKKIHAVRKFPPPPNTPITFKMVRAQERVAELKNLFQPCNGSSSRLWLNRYVVKSRCSGLQASSPIFVFFDHSDFYLFLSRIHFYAPMVSKVA